MEDRRADAADLVEVGGRHDDVLVDAITNDLVGARLSIRAALAEDRPSEYPGAVREELGRMEHEAAHP